MRVYLLQWNIIWNDKFANFDKIRSLLNSQRVETGGLILLPEMFATGFMHAPKAGIAEDFSNPNSPTVSFLSSLANETSCLVLGGGISNSKNELKNHVGFFEKNNGVESAGYEKIKPFFSEKKNFQPGSEISVFNWNNFQISSFICYDLRFPELFRKAISLGATAFYVGASWPSIRQSHWKTLLRARAIENQAYIFGVNRTGKDPYTSYSGGSCIISPKGEILAEASDEECVISAEIDSNEVLEWRQEFPVLNDFFS